MLRILFLLCLLVSSVSLGKADTFIITSGQFNVSGVTGDIFTHSTFSGGGLSAGLNTHSFAGVVPSATCPFAPYCAPGNLISLNAQIGQLDGSDLSGGFTINGQFYRIQFPNGAAIFNFMAGSVTIPFGNDPMVTLTAPFTFSGALRSDSPPNGVTAALIGSGTAYLFLTLSGLEVPGGHAYRLDHISYQFQAVPEPGTWILLSTGLGFVGLVRRRLRGN